MAETYADERREGQPMLIPKSCKGPSLQIDGIHFDADYGNVEFTVVDDKGKFVATLKYAFIGKSPPDFDLRQLLAADAQWDLQNNLQGTLQ